jgi:hypothetical protein
VDRIGCAVVLAVLILRVLCTQFGNSLVSAIPEAPHEEPYQSLATKAQTASHTASEGLQIALNLAMCPTPDLCRPITAQKTYNVTNQLTTFMCEGMQDTTIPAAVAYCLQLSSGTLETS